uniref:F-box domain-containing protein n=1 Tax=Steinernema glaseri TaxID=37863 RepID=A0A1I7ZJ36_9BILA
MPGLWFNPRLYRFISTCNWDSILRSRALEGRVMPEARGDAPNHASFPSKLEGAVATTSSAKTESSLKPPRRPRAVSAARLPHHVLVVVFQHLSVKDLASCMRVCRHWNAVLEYQDNYVWEFHARREVPESALVDPYLLSDVQSHKEKLRAFRFAWSPRDISRYI